MPKALPSRQCRKCTGYYMPKRESQAFCTDTCRNAYYDEHYFHKITATKVCPNCGEKFDTDKPYLQTYCIGDCRIDARAKTLRGEELRFMGKAVQSMMRVIEEHPEGPRGRNESLGLKEKLGQMGYKFSGTKISATVEKLAIGKADGLE